MGSFKLNNKGVRELLTSDEMEDVLVEFGRQALMKLDDGYAISVYTGKKRSNVSVFAQTPEAQRDNLENNSILKAVFS